MTTFGPRPLDAVDSESEQTPAQRTIARDAPDVWLAMPEAQVSAPWLGRADHPADAWLQTSPTIVALTPQLVSRRRSSS